MKTLAASLSILTREGVMLYLLRGVAFTCIISVLGVIMGLIVGSLLALARTYCKKGPARILGWFATAYIELFRNTPYLLWIFICVVFCPCPGFFARKMFGLTSVEMKLLFKAALALILFNSSVIAEIVRGGLNGVSKGQFEAGYAQGFNTAECCSTSSCRRPTATSCRPCSARSSPPSRTPPIWQMWPPSS
ncbi:MAG: ABC transporter permease subunit [Faecalibacterium prausnitzii]